MIWYSLLNAALGLQYLHDSGIVHGDLKANNILVGADNVVKLADFGLSASTKGAQSASAGGALGAYRWKAPECLQGEMSTFASDVYSFAMVMVEVLTGLFPWGALDDSVVKFLVKRGERLKQPSEIASPEWGLIERMCRTDPTERVTIDAVVVHLSSLVENLAMPNLWQSVRGEIPVKSFQNRVASRGGALLSLLTLARSRNERMMTLTAERLIAVHFNRGVQSDEREVQGIINILACGGEAQKAWEARALGNLSSQNQMNAADIVAAGALPLLVSLAHDGTDSQKEKSAAALANLSCFADNHASIAAAGAIGPFVALLRGGPDPTKVHAALALKCLALNTDYQTLIVQAGGIGPLVVLVRDGDDLQKGGFCGCAGKPLDECGQSSRDRSRRRH